MSLLEQDRLTPRETAERAGVHVDTVLRWISTGIKGEKLKAFRVGGRRYILVSDLDQFIRSINQ